MSWWSRFRGRDIRAGLEFSPQAAYTLLSYGFPYGSYGAMYRRQPAVRTVVDFLARNIGQLNPKLYERLDQSDRLELDDHPAARVLRKPNPLTTRYRHNRDTVSDIAIYDRAYWLKMHQRGRVVALVRLAPPKVTPVTNQSTGRTVYETSDGNTYSREQLVIFSGYNPDGESTSVPPLETLRQVLAEEWAALLHRERFWRNGAKQNVWVERPNEAPKLSNDAFARHLEQLNAMVTGENTGKVGLLEEGEHANPVSFSPKDSSYIEGRMLTLAEVCRLYGGGALMSMIGAGTDTKASTEARHREGYQDVFGPLLRLIQDEIELQLLPEFDFFDREGRVYVEFNLQEKLKGSFEEQSKALVSAVGVPYMTPNEGRARLNLPRIDDDAFDEPIKPLNVMYGGQAAVTEPTEDPGDA